MCHHCAVVPDRLELEWAGPPEHSEQPIDLPESTRPRFLPRSTGARAHALRVNRKAVLSRPMARNLLPVHAREHEPRRQVGWQQESPTTRDPSTVGVAELHQEPQIHQEPEILKRPRGRRGAVQSELYGGSEKLREDGCELVAALLGLARHAKAVPEGPEGAVRVRRRKVPELDPGTGRQGERRSAGSGGGPGISL